MKIITMCKVIEDGEPLPDDDYTQSGPRDWFCAIETKEEELVYDTFLEFLHGDDAGDKYSKAYISLWNSMVNHAGLYEGVKWGDDDIYAYIRPDEGLPMIGEEYKIDNDTWQRVA